MIRRWVGIRRKYNFARIADAIRSDVNVDLPKLSEKEREKIIKFYDCILSNSNDMSKKIKEMVADCPLVINAYRGVDFEMFNKNIVPKGPFLDKTYPRFLYLGGFPNSIDIDGAKDVKGGLYLLEAWQ